MEQMNKISGGGKIFSATRSDEEFFNALNARPRVIFDLNPDIMNVAMKQKKAQEAGKKLFVHIDLAKGIGKDESGIHFLHRIGIDGIISTKINIIKMARDCGLSTVQRFFIVDSHSVETTVEAVRTSRPDMIEIMPGTVPKVIVRLQKLTDIPLIAGGLIETEDEVTAALLAGASAVSTAKRALWELNF